jgi:LacI family transcriptional regulator
MKVTIKEIAKLADVSIATVSKVVNHKDEKISSPTRDRVLNIIKETGYVPNRIASSMVTKKTNTLGLLIPDIANPFFPELARGAEDMANKMGYTLILCNSDNKVEKEDAYLEMLQEKMVDGIIFVASSRRTELSSALQRMKVPVITVDREIPGLSVQAKITVDNESGAYEAVSHMIDRGYRKIYHLAGPQTSLPARQRYEGYMRAMKEQNISFPEKYLMEGRFSSNWGVEAVSKLLEEDIEFDGLFCGNDLIALGAMKCLHQNGINVPDQIGVVGFDDINMAQLISPELTTVNQPNYEMGYKAAELLIKTIGGVKTRQHDYILKTRLIQRGTTR